MKTIEKITKERHYAPVLGSVLINDGMARATNLDTWIEEKTGMDSGLYYGSGIDINAIASDIPADRFPLPYDLGARLTRVSLDYGTFIDYFKFVGAAMSKEQMRYYLNGIAFDSDTIVATDGHRLHGVTIHSARFEHKDFPNGAICPRDTIKYALLFAKEHKKQKPNVTISLHEKGFDFEFHGIGRVFSKLVDGNFPQWKKVVPEKKSLAQGAFDSRLFNSELKTLKALQKIAGNKKIIIALSDDGKAQWDAGDLKHEFQSGLILQGARTAFNIQYFIDTELTGGDFYYDSGDNQNPCRIVQKEKLAVIMPARI